MCLSLTETAKANGIDFYQYLVKLLTDSPIYRQTEILQDYMPCSKNIQAACAK
ncbi:transposase domain-containing protein [Rummeliibacillus sp. SL167]|uniref:transposase domain-containing protein n=1 Tax=Rummeliibacillus sp. SL167 TaxID=2579792 RepID=UPI00351A45AE